MTKLEHLIAIAEEECCELAQRCSKALRFGMTEIQPVSTGGDGQTDNRTRLREEYIDVVTMMEMLDILPPYTDEKTRKKEKVMKFLAYSSECGTVDDASPSDARFTPVEEGTAIGSATQTSSSSVTDTPDGSERPPAAIAGPQMTDIYGEACDVHEVRQFRDGRSLGAGYDLRAPAAWFVYDREQADMKWHKHCGPYSTFEQAKWWIQGIREVR